MNPLVSHENRFFLAPKRSTMKERSSRAQSAFADARTRTAHFDVRITHDEDTDTVTIDTVPETHDVTIHNGSIVINIDEITDAYFAPTRVILNGIEIHYEDDPLEWMQLTHHTKYDISTTTPYMIRNHATRIPLKQSTNSMGYYQVSIDGKTCPIHRLVAEQFIHNDDPEHKTEVDHIDRNKINNAIENLRWVTHSENQSNRKKWKKQPSEYINLADINQDDMIQLGEYNGHVFSRHFYNRAMDKLFLHQPPKKTVGEKYKIVKPIRQGKDGNTLTVSLISDEFTKTPKGNIVFKTYTKSYTELLDYIKKREGIA